MDTTHDAAGVIDTSWHAFDKAYKAGDKPYNKFLPLDVNLEEEAAMLFEEITKGFEDIVVRQEYNAGVRFWCKRIETYLSLHGYACTTEQLVALIRLLWELLLLPNMDPNLQSRLARSITRLINHADVLPTEALELPWQPLYALFRKYHMVRMRDAVKVGRGHGQAIIMLLRYARRFFPASATDEILAEFEPLLCPHDECLYVGAASLCLLLPADPLSRAKDSPSFLTWIPRMLEVWRWSENNKSWDILFFSLINRVLKRNPTLTAFDDNWPWIMSKVLNNFELPVANSRNTMGKYMAANAALLQPQGGFEQRVACIIVNSLSPTSPMQGYFERLLASIEGFLHPSNTGPWSTKIAEFLSVCASEMTSRLHKETEERCITPVENRITLQQREAFVITLRDAVFTVQLSKNLRAAYAMAGVLKHLAYIAPQALIPLLLEKVYPALESVMESHATMAAFSALSTVVRPLFTPSIFPEGSQHLVPLLHSVLPAIDLNDVVKTSLAFNFLQEVLAQVVLVDCSKGPFPSNMTEEEHSLYLSTAQLEDWCVLLLNQCLTLLESQVAASAKGYSIEQSIQQRVIVLWFYFFQQLSPALAATVRKALLRWVQSHLVLDAAKAVAWIVHASAIPYPKETLAMFLPYLCDTILQVSQQERPMDDEAASDDQAAPELLWSLHILARLVKHNGIHLLPYREQLMDVLSACLPLASKTANKLTHKLLRHLLLGLTGFGMPDKRSVPPSVWAQIETDPVAVFNARGKLTNLNSDLATPVPTMAAEFVYTLPGQETVVFAQELVTTLVMPRLEALSTINWTDQSSYTRRTLRSTMLLLRNISRLGPYALKLDLHPLAPQDHEGSTYLHQPMLPIAAAALPEDWPLTGTLFSNVLLSTLQALQTHRPSDTRSATSVIKATFVYLSSKGIRDKKFRLAASSADGLASASSGDPIYRRRLCRRRTAAFKVALASMKRVSTNRQASVSLPLQVPLLQELLGLAVSPYAQVRAKAQGAVASILVALPTVKLQVFEFIVKTLASPAEQDDEAQLSAKKGSLYLASSPAILKLMGRRYDCLQRMMEALDAIAHIDKQSIHSLVSHISNELRSNMEYQTFGHMQAEVLNTLVALRPAAQARQGEFEQALSAQTDQEALFEAGVQKVSGYLSQWLAEPGRHWKYELIFADKLTAITAMRPAIGPKAIEVFLTGSVSDNYELRKLCIANVALLLSQLKQSVKRCELTYSRSQKALVPLADEPKPAYLGLAELEQLGSRPDTAFFSYHTDVALRPTLDTYDQQMFIDKNFAGFTGWTQVVRAYAPLATTSALVATDDAAAPDVSLLTISCNRALLPSAELLTALFAHFTVETANDDQSGYQDFQDAHADLFKGWLRNYGPVMLERLKPHVDLLMAELDKRSPQRCLAEVLGGLVRGIKHWPAAALQAAYDWLLPLLNQAFAKMTNETLPFWVSFARQCSYDKDPRRFYPLLDWFFDFDLSVDAVTSIQLCSRLLVAQNAMAELSWRGSELAVVFAERLLPFTTHPFKLVREQIARALFITTRSLQAYRAVSESSSTSTAGEGVAPADAIVHNLLERCVPSPGTATDEDTAHLKTTLCYLISVYREGAGQVLAEHFCRVLSLLLELPDSGDDPELQGLTRTALALAARLQLAPALVDQVLTLFRTASSDGSWHYRIRLLGFVQVFIFRNLFAADGDVVLQLLLELMQDEHVEVRLAAAVPLAGAIQCGIIAMSPDLLTRFTSMLPALPKHGRRKKSKVEEDAKTIACKHAAVLGLKALLLAHPYSFPDWMPDLLMAIGSRINEREPIKATVQQALSEFWRTHQDSWHLHKLKLSEDQVLFLQDLLISPSYYA
eukprot:m.261590 g.261590  ORF g.261590 m.261590 type:complete len:1846 (+) comp17601_c0_seq2:42-5579(+)